MNKIINRTKTHIENEKKKYLFLITVTLIGIISGILFIIFISNKDKLLVKDNIESIINTINNHKLDTFKVFINSLWSNILSLLFIYLLAISIIGMPLIILFLFIKGFTFGFSISSLINTYHFKGILLSLSYLFPHHFILLIIYILLGFYSINFSIRLFRYLFLKENINLLYYFKNLNKILLISFIIVIICSLIETFLSPILIDLCI